MAGTARALLPRITGPGHITGAAFTAIPTAQFYPGVAVGVGVGYPPAFGYYGAPYYGPPAYYGAPGLYYGW